MGIPIHVVAWLPPFGKDTLTWLIPSTMLFLLIPLFFASWFIEYQTIKRLMSSHDFALIRFAVRRANIYTYVTIAVFILVLWIFGMFPKAW